MGVSKGGGCGWRGGGWWWDSTVGRESMETGGVQRRSLGKVESFNKWGEVVGETRRYCTTLRKVESGYISSSR